jgi:aryl-alcohol dehydrogenase-like predicted oxidoreductase
MVLGSAQIGLLYGAANKSGMPSEAVAIELIRAAVDAGVDTIDTARAYGDAERRIGLALVGRPDVEIVTKLDPLANLDSAANPAEAVETASRSLSKSLSLLRRDRIDVLLLHRGHHRTSWSGAVWEFLVQEQLAGRIKKLGVSVSSPNELLSALSDRFVAHVQLPCNILDYRWSNQQDVLAKLAVRNVTVHCRSAYLQGLLASPGTARWPYIEGFTPEPIVAELMRLVRVLGRDSIQDLCLAYVRSLDWVDGIVIGQESRAQLAENLRLFSRPKLMPADLAAIANASLDVPSVLLDPSEWERQ